MDINNPTMLESKIGDAVEMSGKKFTIMKEFSQGADAKLSGYSYFMYSPKGVFGLKETE